ncbi:MAG: organoarsenical effux MFS transporter ArsJ [Verrucomicrobiales bacterium]|nr:organoarsenical effux MFS transporter ArsJ [Verrucomicrobiales bacterium]
MNSRDYVLVTAAYWGFTITDGALRMLVLLHFHGLGYSPVQIAFLFLLYEFCGILTNLFGGWIGSRVGLKATLFAGLTIQIGALSMLSFLDPAWTTLLSVSYVMISQALSGIAKDLTKMSSKSSVKLLVPSTGESSHSERLLFKLVAILTGSKNALKGVGFFFGALLLTWIGFAPALWSMAGALFLILVFALILLKGDLGRSKEKVKFSKLFAKSREINLLSAARFFLFGSRDLWFVVALPIFLAEGLGWSFWKIGAFMAAWVVGYGLVQASAPALIRRKAGAEIESGAKAALGWGIALALVTAGMAFAVEFEFHTTVVIFAGLALFGIIFAVNSSVHSYLILAYTDSDKVALNVGFYYMANACGRLVGTLLSGVVYLWAGLPGCLWTSAGFIIAAVCITIALPGAPRKMAQIPTETPGHRPL